MVTEFVLCEVRTAFLYVDEVQSSKTSFFLFTVPLIKIQLHDFKNSESVKSANSTKFTNLMSAASIWVSLCPVFQPKIRM